MSFLALNTNEVALVDHVKSQDDPVVFAEAEKLAEGINSPNSTGSRLMNSEMDGQVQQSK